MSRALLIIDFQNDFTSGGALEVPGGTRSPSRSSAWPDQFDHVFATRDWHPPDHASFETEGGPWPVHCVQGTHGAELHPAMRDIEVEAIVDVGVERDDEGYSGFEKSKLADLLHEAGVDEVAVVGLATDYCVRASAIDACREGFDTTRGHRRDPRRRGQSGRRRARPRGHEAGRCASWRPPRELVAAAR